MLTGRKVRCLHGVIGMRRDFILPALLLVALAAMGVYATTAEKQKATDDLLTNRASCDGGRLISRLALLPEASGLALSTQFPNLLWSHNDSSDATIFAIGTDGAIRGRVRLAGASVTDWEAITVSPCRGGACLYVGDIGDNNLRRHGITIYRTREPSPDDQITPSVERIEATYPEGPQDAEALFVANGSLFVVTKGE